MQMSYYLKLLKKTNQLVIAVPDRDSAELYFCELYCAINHGHESEIIICGTKVELGSWRFKFDLNNMNLGTLNLLEGTKILDSAGLAGRLYYVNGHSIDWEGRMAILREKIAMQSITANKLSKPNKI